MLFCLYCSIGIPSSPVKALTVLHVLFAVVAVPFRCYHNMPVSNQSSFFLLLFLFSFFFFFLVSLSSSRDREIRYEGSGRLTITFRSNLQPHTIQMEPLLGTPLGVTSHHLAITNAITIAIRQLISIDLGILFVALGSRLGALVISGGAVLLRRNELCCLARTFLVAPFVVRDRLLERSARGA